MLNGLTEEQTSVVRRALCAAVDGPFFEEREFKTLFGLARDEVGKVLDEFPRVRSDEETVFLAISNALNNLLGYPHGMERKLRDDFDLDHEKLNNALTQFRKICSPVS